MLKNISNVWKTSLLGLVLVACGSEDGDKLPILTSEQAVGLKKDKSRLPILGRKETTQKVVEGEEVIDTTYYTVPGFELLNQDSVLTTVDSLGDVIYTADFFFTTCPSICPIIKKKMMALYEAYKDDPRIKFVSISLDPEYDTPSRLTAYAKGLGVYGEQWQFLTGDKAYIYDLAEQGYMISAFEDEKTPGGIAHSGAITLVDKEGHIRGYYDGTIEEEIQELISDISVLFKEQP